MQTPLQPAVAAWLEKIKLALDFKGKRFGKDAEEGMRFLGGTVDWLYGSGRHKDRHFREADDDADDNEIPAPRFQMSVNKTAEMVQIFGPVLYHKNPVRQVNPRTQPELPAALIQQAMQSGDQRALMGFQQLAVQSDLQRGVDEARAGLLAHYLNYTPTALDLKTESRWAIDEALIKGMGCLSGGTLVYAKIDGRHTVIRVRDLYRVGGETHLWDGASWNRVLGIKKKPRVGDELKFHLRSGEEVNCTADHGWPTGRGLLRADQVVVGDSLSYAKLDQPTNDAGDLLPDEVGWFVGLYLGDGHIPRDKNDVVVCVAGHVDETERHDRLELLVKRYGGHIRWNRREGTKKCDATIYSRVMVAIIREYVAVGGAFDKHLKTTCWERSDSFLRSLLDGYLDSDGHWVKDEDTWRLGFCDNKHLANSLRVLVARLGLRMTLKRKIQSQTGKPDVWVHRGSVRTRPSKNGYQVDLGEVVEISPADWRCDYYYDISVENEPHTYCLASGLVTHNCLWQEPYRPPAGGTAMVGSFYDSVDNLVIDPDMPSLRHAKWVARRRCEHAWEAERKFNLPPGTLKPAAESVNQQAEVNANPNGSFLRESGQTADLVVYWEVFSKCGLGGRLKGAADWSRAPLEQFGDHCYLAVARGIPYPLNVPEALWDLPEGQAADAITQAVQWPTPYWADGAWPFTPISFHDIPGDPWPMSHLSPAMGELKFLNWVYSFVAGKIRITCRDFIAIKASAGEEIKTAVTSGSDYELIEINSSHGTIDEVVKFLQHPQFNGDIWRVIEYVAEQFDRRTGLTELMYGATSSQLRSAAEAEIKSSQMSVRPDDMANKVEDAMSLAARQEAFCARWHLTSRDVAPVMGPVGASLWESFVVPSDPAEILYQLEYRIEAGSARKPNKQRDAENIQNAMQQLMPFFQNIAMQGMVDPFNALVTAWAKAMDMDPTPLVLPQPPALVPPQPQPQPQPQPAGAPA